MELVRTSKAFFFANHQELLLINPIDPFHRENEMRYSMKFKPQYLMIGCALILMCTSCSRQSPSDEASAPRPVTSATCKEISPEARSRLVTGIAKINLGDSQASVEATLGAPTTREDLTNKQATRVYGTMLYYVVRSCSNDGRVRHGDSFARLYFHSGGDLFVIEAFGIDGIQHRTTLPPPPKGE